MPALVAMAAAAEEVPAVAVAVAARADQVSGFMAFPRRALLARRSLTAPVVRAAQVAAVLPTPKALEMAAPVLPATSPDERNPP
jgi:hypothetical protein